MLCDLQVFGEAVGSCLEEDECREGHSGEHPPPHPGVDGDTKHGSLPNIGEGEEKGERK